MSKMLSYYFRFLAHVVGGIAFGIVLGLGFGVLIAYIAGQFPIGDDGGPLPLAIGAFLGMGVGATVGGIFGGVVGYKK